MSGIILKEVPRPECGKAVGSGKPAPAEGIVSGGPDATAREAARQLDRVTLGWSFRA
jgi:hypothetical protein